ncbi:GNAT family N-acetyltransferase [Alteromonas pelagimontana]|uniref:GNAT family N-acetyltransferase n=1 Tax=Alteromonas pelagimontana TaxID=1858656 RepID=A0A6M4MHB8_9ALTE|nr:GNAT family N-acetyltransferase [Alteromonas pelagimontana]QJR81965.1 GNAT family N-acetyltransferase [Alteromonas pelagimontana]
MKARLDIGYNAFLTLEQPWKALEERVNAIPFIRFEWCKVQAAFRQQPIVLSVWSEASCIAILPLVQKPLSKKLSLPVLTHLCERFTDYQCMLVDSKVEIKDCLNAMFSLPAFKQFQQFPLLIPYPDAQLFEALSSQSTGISSLGKYSKVSYYQHWQHTQYDVSREKLKAKVLREARRRQRKLQEPGNVSIHWSHEYDAALIDWILDSSARRYGDNALTRRESRDCVQALFAVYRSSLHLACIKQDGEFIAGHLGFIYNGTLMYYVPVTSEVGRSHSPGIIMLNEIIQHMNALGVTCIDYLRGDEDYKADWGNVQEPKCGIFCHPAKGLNIVKPFIYRMWLSRNQ